MRGAQCSAQHGSPLRGFAAAEPWRLRHPRSGSRSGWSSTMNGSREHHAMIGKRRKRLVLVAGCLMAITTAPAARAQQTPVQPQLITNGPQLSPGDNAGETAAERNARESGRYENFLRSNPAFRARRIEQECGPITDPALHASCVASFDAPKP